MENKEIEFKTNAFTIIPKALIAICVVIGVVALISGRNPLKNIIDIIPFGIFILFALPLITILNSFQISKVGINGFQLRFYNLYRMVLEYEIKTLKCVRAVHKGYNFIFDNGTEVYCTLFQDNKDLQFIEMLKEIADRKREIMKERVFITLYKYKENYGENL